MPRSVSFGTVRARFCLDLAVLLQVATFAHGAASDFFRINVVDGETGKGVPLVQLKTSHYVSLYTDSAGIAAFNEPGMMDQPVYFYVQSDGYRFTGSLPKAPQPGVLLRTTPGSQATVVLNRTQHAERAYRMTGAGIYRDSVLVGAPAPISEPLLPRGGVVGQDSLLAVVYKGKAYWFFGDTECPAGPRNTDCQHYGKFTTGATSCVPGVDKGCTVPPSLHYFTSNDSRAPGGMADDGRPSEDFLRDWNPDGFTHPKAMIAGPLDGRFDMNTWVGTTCVVRQGDEERMYTAYDQPQQGGASGLARWDDEKEVFVPVGGQQPEPGIQWVMKQRPEDGNFIYYANPFVQSRMPATFAGVENSSETEYFTPCSTDPKVACTKPMNGSSWGWKKGVAAFGADDEKALIKKGLLAAEDARMQVHDSKGGEIAGFLARGSVAWNAYRQKYILLADQQADVAIGSGSGSRYGEIWYCEAPSMTGPWTSCTRVVTHAATGTSCYNPLQLTFMDEGDGRVVYLACTFTSMWSAGAPGAPSPVNSFGCQFAEYGGVDCSIAVPRYEYNNLVYRLDLEKMARKEGWTQPDAMYRI